MMSIDSVCIASTGPPFINCIVATCNKKVHVTLC